MHTEPDTGGDGLNVTKHKPLVSLILEIYIEAGDSSLGGRTGAKKRSKKI
jgi:hypothetical protein